MKKLVVLCLNDYAIGLYSTAKKADAAALADWQRREPRWKEVQLKFGQTYCSGLGNFHKWHYHQHSFKVDAAAQL